LPAPRSGYARHWLTRTKQQIVPILMIHLAGQDGAQLDAAVSAPASDSYPEYC
jgi:hypothetical protein